jgi:hypothetical protein
MKVKTTVIEKKTKSGSIKINYAKVVDRLNVFREENPRSKIHTEISRSDKGIVVRAFIWKDKTDFVELLAKNVAKDIALLSCDATGTAEYAKDDEKKVEKLETIAVGRGLALLGYAASGEVATSEEMEEFEEWKANILIEAIESACNALQECKTMADLQKTYLALEPAIRAEKKVVSIKDEMKGKL